MNREALATYTPYRRQFECSGEARARPAWVKFGLSNREARRLNAHTEAPRPRLWPRPKAANTAPELFALKVSSVKPEASLVREPATEPPQFRSSTTAQLKQLVQADRKAPDRRQEAMLNDEAGGLKLLSPG
ncbi:hypothetical protein SKAU_G00381130 [Synaphobranchus kaupii]|uniref:Uncharacterized protein n=1 Tax=Synaphobranchus kaupii TaxID=118154 RepID=A0A9Q1EDP6_SYNKA|nr:hypothetical protein SKAU_G00381130 [Synaphobranchus kaupii]